MREELITLLQNENEMIYLPDLMNFLKQYNNIVLTGGGINECLKRGRNCIKSFKQIISDR